MAFFCFVFCPAVAVLNRFTAELVPAGEAQPFTFGSSNYSTQRTHVHMTAPTRGTHRIRERRFFFCKSEPSFRVRYGQVFWTF